MEHQALAVLPRCWGCTVFPVPLEHPEPCSSSPIVPQMLRTGEMWLLLVALCLAQGLKDAIPGAEVFYNPEMFMNISQKILFHGYPSEEHDVMTADGYFLSLNRIPHGKGDAGLSGPRTPVLIVHGFCLDGGDWVDNFPNSSLAFILADAGYDVWIGNNRGNSWSRRHRSLSISSEEFWDFRSGGHQGQGWGAELSALSPWCPWEVGRWESPPGSPFATQLPRDGHVRPPSYGGLHPECFIAFSSLPHLAEKIRLFFALAPVYTFHHVQGPVLKLVFLPDLLLKGLFGTRELVLVPRREKEFLAAECSKLLAAEACADSIFVVGGFDRNNLNTSRLDVYLSHFPDYTSVKNLLHWGQTAKSAHFRQFDYGLRNMEKYKQLTPPHYQIEAMRVPVALWSGGHDRVTPPVETQRLLSRLTSIVHKEHFPDWNHFDHHWGLNAPQRMYRQMVALMKQNPNSRTLEKSLGSENLTRLVMKNSNSRFSKEKTPTSPHLSDDCPASRATHQDFPVQNLGGIEAQDEIHVVPVGNHLVVQQVLDLGEEEGSVPGVSQAVLPRVPDGRGHLHALHVVERSFLWGQNLPSVLRRGENKTNKDLTKVSGLAATSTAGCPQGTSETLFGTGRSLGRFTCSQWIMFWTEEPAGTCPTYTSNRLCKDTSTLHSRIHLAPHNRALPRLWPSEGPSADSFPHTMFVFFQLNPKTLAKRCLQTLEQTQNLERISSPRAHLVSPGPGVPSAVPYPNIVASICKDEAQAVVGQVGEPAAAFCKETMLSLHLPHFGVGDGPCSSHPYRKPHCTPEYDTSGFHLLERRKQIMEIYTAGKGQSNSGLSHLEALQGAR
ncbi:hypothetical protein IHE44_0007651 [Lamprotornis superbus]|uniref:Partial AB-hydrolase lipase domain-containing protein n=1 Tax=Lamprotornis superbus TaxID=245042 RepID=A0A835NH21_9PASS|nr:hypothetical protein IHE44_0007651 [Lamprotornis superbus]